MNIREGTLLMKTSVKPEIVYAYILGRTMRCEVVKSKPMNRAAQALGRRAKGIPKKFSKKELAKRTERIIKARAEFLIQHLSDSVDSRLAKPKPTSE
jgi:hypothetical protein